jgi:ABC-type multidrug transport system fused ATPase/permease subunit
MKGKVTLIATAHRHSTVESCDCIFLMERAHLVTKGSYDELLSNSELFRSLTSG